MGTAQSRQADCGLPAQNQRISEAFYFDDGLRNADITTA
jgi:hypothetical protein